MLTKTAFRQCLALLLHTRPWHSMLPTSLAGVDAALQLSDAEMVEAKNMPDEVSMDANHQAAYDMCMSHDQQFRQEVDGFADQVGGMARVRGLETVADSMPVRLRFRLPGEPAEHVDDEKVEIDWSSLEAAAAPLTRGRLRRRVNDYGSQNVLLRPDDYMMWKGYKIRKMDLQRREKDADWLKRCERALRQNIEKDPERAAGYLFLGGFLVQNILPFRKQDVAGAEAAFLKATQLKPSRRDEVILDLDAYKNESLGVQYGLLMGDDDRLTVSEVLDGSPCKGRLVEGDVLLEVNGIDLRQKGSNSEETLELLTTALAAARAATGAGFKVKAERRDQDRNRAAAFYFLGALQHWKRNDEQAQPGYEGKPGDVGSLIEHLSPRARSREWPLTYAEIACRLQENGDVAGAVVAYRKSIELDSHQEFPHLYARLADLLRTNNDAAGAEAVYRKGIELMDVLDIKRQRDRGLHVPVAEMCVGLGDVLALQGQLSAAVKVYQKAIHVLESSLVIDRQWAIMRMGMAWPDPDGSIKKAYLDPTHNRLAAALFNLGLVQEEEHDLDAAEVSYRKAIQFDPDYGWVQEKLASCDPREDAYKRIAIRTAARVQESSTDARISKEIFDGSRPDAAEVAEFTGLTWRYREDWKRGAIEAIEKGAENADLGNGDIARPGAAFLEATALDPHAAEEAYREAAAKKERGDFRFKSERSWYLREEPLYEGIGGLPEGRNNGGRAEAAKTSSSEMRRSRLGAGGANGSGCPEEASTRDHAGSDGSSPERKCRGEERPANDSRCPKRKIGQELADNDSSNNERKCKRARAQGGGSSQRAKGRCVSESEWGPNFATTSCDEDESAGLLRPRRALRAPEATGGVESNNDSSNRERKAAAAMRGSEPRERQPVPHHHWAAQPDSQGPTAIGARERRPGPHHHWAAQPPAAAQGGGGEEKRRDAATHLTSGDESATHVADPWRGASAENFCIVDHREFGPAIFLGN